VLKSFLAIVSFSCSFVIQGQIVNGSFEQNSSIPSSMGQWQVVNGWSNAGSAVASPDYYHYDGAMAADLPETPFAIVQANQGDAVMGFIACGRPNTNSREYISTQLLTPLHVGRKYVIGFKITNGDKTSTSLAGLGVDKLGLLFSVGPVSQTAQSPINATPQLVVNEVVYDPDWQTINFIFEPTVAYTHMTFGLFGDDSDKNISIVDGVDPQFAYYFVDSFVMECVHNGFDVGYGEKDPPVTADTNTNGVNSSASSDEPFFVPNSFTPNQDGNNEFFKPISNTIKEWEFEIFTKWGDRVFFTADEFRGWDGTYNGMSCENGSYVWQISYMIFDQNQESRRIETRGIVNLVR
jgi:gliding motility-associated-like protein